MEQKRRNASAGGWLLRPPRGTQIIPLHIGELPARWIIPRGANEQHTVLYLHGGGWVYGWAPFYDMFVGRLAGAAQARTLAIDYRLAPEHPFPAAVEDCLTAYRYLIDSGTPPAKIAIMGDSAGGNLTLVTLLTARQAGLPLPAAGVCLSPATDFASHGPSYTANINKDAILKRSFTGFASKAYLAGHDPCDPLASPIYGDLVGLPPLLIQAGGDEILLSDAESFAAKAGIQGVDVTLQVYPGMWHAWQMFAPYLPEAQHAVEEIGKFIREKVA